MTWSPSGGVLALLLGLPGCGLLHPRECGEGTVERDGLCVPVEDSGEADADTDADGDSDADADADGDADVPAVARYAGTISRLPLTLAIPELDADALPLLVVYLSWDDGETWRVTENSCNGGVGQEIRDGELEIQSTYCTSGATDYQVVVQEAEEHISTQRTSGSRDVDTSWASLDDPPLITVYNSTDGETWHLDHGTCGAPDSWRMYDGTVEIRDTNCSGALYQIAFGTPEESRTGTFPYSTQEFPRLVSPDALPILVPLFGSDSGGYFESTYDCGTASTNLWIEADGTVQLIHNYCTPGDSYGLSVGK
ncbi:MAG: hypothetical protein ABIO70_10450 [Pseudomonadota bacterium]